MGGWRPRDLGAGGEDQLLFLATPSLSWLLQKRSRVWGGGGFFFCLSSVISLLRSFFLGTGQGGANGKLAVRRLWIVCTSP